MKPLSQALSLSFLILMSAPQAEVKSLSGYTVDTEGLCGGFPKVALKTTDDTCLGLVATEESGLKRPRRILSVGEGLFIVTDMYGWVANKGIVWLFDSKSRKLTKLFDKVDQAHGLGMGPDGLIYVGTRTSIFRFNLENHLETKETVISDLPLEGNHPLTHFIFDGAGNLIVNVGAPSDQCLDDKDRPQYPCPVSEGDDPEASLRLYFRDGTGAYPSYKVIAKGLRNSMALAIEPNSGQLFQGENGMDFKDADTPLEEINLIEEGAHYGWPYCYEDGLLNPKYKRSLLNRRIPKIDCSIYKAPVAHLPPHSAPLDMMFYQGDLFPEFQGKLIVTLHGYRETGHRIVSLDLNEQFLPLENSRTEIVTNWSSESGLTPKGSPVGMTTDKEGNIWFVEDKNKTIMVLTRGDSNVGDLGGNTLQIKLSASQVNAYKGLDESIFTNSCQSCHDQFSGDPKSVVPELIKSGLIKPGLGKESPLYQRLIGTEAGQRMPLGAPAIKSELSIKLKDFIDSLK
ncbi:MAG: PQQ-dependent sugar dehydrogenase [Bacteriovoracaceae bacterium]|nr:PQQ-dependent sugar dehydrogenase [Bacteriovoracaceae bacterium]